MRQTKLSLLLKKISSKSIDTKIISIIPIQMDILQLLSLLMGLNKRQNFINRTINVNLS